MKIGRYVSLGNYKNIKIGYGTIDNNELKTIYVKLNSWLMPNDDIENFDKKIFNTRRNIKNIIYTYNFNNLFKKESIVDMDLKTRSMKLMKNSFMNLEITLYVNQEFNLKSKENKTMIKNFIKTVIDDCMDNTFFSFSLKKD